MSHDCAYIFLLKPNIHGTQKNPLVWGGVRLNLPEYTWSVIANGHYEYRRASLAIEYTILFYPHGYYRAHHGWAQRNIFKIKVFGLLENAILGLVFANTVFYKRATLLIFEAEFTESVL